MIGKLDRYVWKSVLGSYAAGLMFFVLLSTLLDLLYGLTKYVAAAQEQNIGTVELAGTLAGYYAMLSPVVFVTVSPFVTVIAAMFSVARLMSANEVIPMLFTGRSVRRVLRPVLLTGVFSALATAGAWEFAIPNLLDPLTEARRTLAGSDDYETAIKNLVIRPEGAADERLTLFCDRFDRQSQRLEGISLVSRRGHDPETIAIVTADAADWNPQLGDWDLVNGLRVAGDLKSPLATLELPSVTPSLVLRASKEGRETIELSYTDLLELQELRPGRRDYVLGFHGHITFPLANLVLLMLALPFAIHFERGSKIERVVFAIMVCAAYLLTDLTCQNLGISLLHPILAAWLPTILFGSIGVVCFTGMKT